MPKSHSAPTDRYEAALVETNRGHFARALKLLSPVDARSTTTLFRESALAAELHQQTGNVTEASRLASQLVRSSHISGTISSRCLAVLGLCAFAAGKLRRSTELFQKAVRAGEEAGDPESTCHAMLCLLGRLAGVSVPGSLASLVSDTQSLVKTINNGSLTARLHLTLGRTEGGNGLLDEADRHFLAAKSLLASTPNAWLEGLYFVDTSTIAFLRSDFANGIRLAEQALACASRSGHQRTRAAALINMGTCYLCQGDHTKAEHYFLKTSETQCDNKEVEAALLDARAELELVRGESHKCEHLLDRIERQFPITKGFKASWYQLSPFAIRVRLMRKQANWTASLELAELGLGLARERGDRLMECTFQVLKAETLIDIGELETSVRVVNEIAPLVESLPPAAAAEVGRVRGRLLAQLGENDGGRRHLARAVRVLSVVGSAHAAGQAEAALGALDATEAGIRSPSGRSAVVDVAAILDLSAHPELLGREALALVAELDCASGAALVMTSNGRPLTVLARHRWTVPQARRIARGTERDQRMAVGESGGRRYYVTVQDKRDLMSHDVLSAVRRLVETAVEMENHRREEQKQAALIPPDAPGASEGVFLSAEMLKIVAVARRIADSDLPVLITGETGTGKEVLAHLIHAASDRSDQPFVAFNCTGLTRDTAESQLFGHRRGSFTDAREDASGVIRGVEGGTLMLDEIGELDHAIQPKLLRFLESGEVQPVGEPKPMTANVRIIAATNAAIDNQVRDGRFREDLFYRLNVVRLRVPPLRDRREEIPPLVNHFLRRYGRELKRGEVTLSQDALRCLLIYDWPGNVRQLGNEIRGSVAMAELNGTIAARDLSPEVRASLDRPGSEHGRGGSEPADLNEMNVRTDQPLSRAIEQVERVMIKRAIHEAGGRVNTAAQSLGLSRKGLFLKRRRLGIDTQAATW